MQAGTSRQLLNVPIVLLHVWDNVLTYATLGTASTASFFTFHIVNAMLQA